MIVRGREAAGVGVYERLGVRRYVNAAATLTRYGGSTMSPLVLEAMAEASRSYVDILELQVRAGERLAALTRNEAAFVSNGAMAGILLAAAAIIAGDDEDARAGLPFTDGMRNEFVLAQAGRVEYDFAITMAGGRRVPYGDENGGTVEELEAAITARTAGIFICFFEHRMGNLPSLDVQIDVARSHRIPVVVDAAAQLPKQENLWRFTQAGADVVVFSGGKGLRGPQSSGLMVGRKELIDRVRSIASPHSGIGRPMKVGKEEIVGLLTAVELFMAQDEGAVLARYERQVSSVVEAFRDDPSVEVVRDFPNEAGQPMPRAVLSLRPGALTVDAEGLAAQLRAGDPGVLVLSRGGELQINPQTLEAGEVEIVIDRLREVIEASRA